MLIQRAKPSIKIISTLHAHFIRWSHGKQQQQVKVQVIIFLHTMQVRSHILQSNVDLTGGQAHRSSCAFKNKTQNFNCRVILPDQTELMEDDQMRISLASFRQFMVFCMLGPGFRSQRSFGRIWIRIVEKIGSGSGLNIKFHLIYVEENSDIQKSC